MRLPIGMDSSLEPKEQPQDEIVPTAVYDAARQVPLEATIENMTPPLTNASNDIQLIAEQMKVEILADMEAGLVPNDCRTFSQLNHYVDATAYADDLVCKLGRDGVSWIPTVDAAQNAVDEWLRGRTA